VTSGCHNISVEIVSPIRTAGAVCLMVLFAVNTFEDMKARLAFLYNKSWRF